MVQSKVTWLNIVYFLLIWLKKKKNAMTAPTENNSCMWAWRRKMCHWSGYDGSVAVFKDGHVHNIPTSLTKVTFWRLDECFHAPHIFWPEISVLPHTEHEWCRVIWLNTMISVPLTWGPSKGQDQNQRSDTHIHSQLRWLVAVFLHPFTSSRVLITNSVWLTEAPQQVASGSNGQGISGGGGSSSPIDDTSWVMYRR